MKQILLEKNFAQLNEIIIEDCCVLGHNFMYLG
jgi:hypothetical protein